MPPPPLNASDPLERIQRSLVLEWFMDRYIDMMKEVLELEPDPSVEEKFVFKMKTHGELIKEISTTIKQLLDGYGPHLTSYEEVVKRAAPELWPIIHKYPPAPDKRKQLGSEQGSPPIEDPYCPFCKEYVDECRHTGRQ